LHAGLSNISQVPGSLVFAGAKVPLRRSNLKPRPVRAGMVHPLRLWGRIIECTRWGHGHLGADGWHYPRV